MNPFKYGQIVSESDYCPRSLLMRELTGHIKAGQNVLIQGERRTGKTSLIFDACGHLKTYHPLFIDLLEVKTLEDVVRRFANAWISKEQKVGMIEKIMKNLAHLRPKVTLDPMTGEPSWELEMAQMAKPDTLEALLDMNEREGKNKHLVVVFDEFQDILNLENAKQILAVMRSKIQFHAKTPYLFAGSIRNKMDEIFTHPDSAFFKSAIPMTVGAIERSIFSNFLLSKFKTGKRKVDPDFWPIVFSTVDDNPGDVQQICSALWEVTECGQKIDQLTLEQATQLIFARESKTYESLLVPITGLQLRCLVGLAQNGPDKTLSARFLSLTGISNAGSVRKALLRLMNLKMIFQTKEGYKFANPFFKQWLLYKKY